MANEIEKNVTGYFSSNLFTATVVSTDPATHVIKIAPDGQKGLQELQGIPLANTFATALGFKETTMPTVYSRVFCQGLGNHLALILGTIPTAESQGDGDQVALPNKLVLAADEPVHDPVHRLGYLKDITKLNVLNNGLPTDVVQGEKVIANEFGVLIGLFQLMAQLRASDLSQVQCHFLDDLVRVISHNFQHYTALGELNVSHDGQAINLEAGYTHDPAESLGQQAITPGEGDSQQFYQSTKNARAIERLKLFVGKLGGFINLLLTLPAAGGRVMDGTDPTTPDDGLLQIKANLDGSLVVRSASGIYLEKTNWIRVPQRIRTPEDPAGDDGAEVTYPDKVPFTFKEDYSYRGTAFLYYLQLKDFLAYTNEELGYADFKTLENDFFVNDDITKSRVAQGGDLVVDPYTDATYKRTRSVVALMANGGISMSDQWGSCISMEGGNIYIQPAKDLVIQPNRHLVAKVGGYTSIATKQDIDLSSTSGGIRVKTDGPQYYYSDNNGILLHGDGNASTKGVTFDPSNDVVRNVSGVVMYAPNSTVTGYGSQVYFNAENSLVLDSSQVTVNAEEWLRLYSKQALTTNSNIFESTSNSSTNIYSKNSVVVVGLGSTSIATSDQAFAIADAGELGKVPVKGFLDPAKNAARWFDGLAKVSADANKFKVSDVLETFKTQAEFDDIAFKFLSSDYYGLADTADVIPQTLSQQQASFQSSGTAWAEKAVNDSYPYPGKDFGQTGYVSLSLSNVISDQEQLANKVIGLVSESVDIQTGNFFTDYKLAL